MSVLSQLLPIFPQLAHQVPAAPKASNVRLVPQPPTVTVSIRHGSLVHGHAGPPGGDDRPARVVAVLGPGATIDGLASVLKPIFDRATGVPAGVALLTPDELAKGLSTYVAGVLPPGPGQRKAGLLLPLPIEVGPGNVWTVNFPAVRSWIGVDLLPGWLSSRSSPTVVLPVPEPAQIEGEASALLAAPGAAAALWDRALRNPSEVVFTFYAAVRLRHRASPADALRFVLAFLDRAKDHHLGLLAVTTPGHAILRRCRTALAAPRPDDVTATKLDAARALVEGAFFTGPPATSSSVKHEDVPLTDDLVGERFGVAIATPGAPTDPVGGLHGFVLGRDVAVGRPTFSGAQPGFLGPTFDGRLRLDPVVTDDIGGLNPTDDATLNGKLALLGADGIFPGTRIDGVSSQSPEVLTAGLGSWAINEPTQLPALLFDLQDEAPDDYDLFFGIHGLVVDRDPADATRFRLRRASTATVSFLIPPDQLPAFFGATTGSDGVVRFGPEWAARFRLAALVSRPWRRVQIRHVLRRLVIDPHELAVATVNPFPSPYVLALDGGGPAPSVQAALLARVAPTDVPGLPVEAGPVGSWLPASTAESRKTLAGFVIDLTGAPAVPHAAGFNPDETFYIGSTGKSVALYAALELRSRLRLAVAAAGDAGFDFRPAGWDKRFAAIVRKTWAARVARGFPPELDTNMPERFPKLDRMFRYTAAAHPSGRATMAGQIDFLPAFHTQATIMVVQSDAGGASRVIDAVGFPYLNGALREAGFYDPGSRRGLWISGNYRSTDWRPKTEPEPGVLSPRGAKHYQPTSNYMGTPRQLARLFALAGTRGLFGDPTASDDMVRYLRKDNSTDPLVTTSWIKESVKATPPGVGARPAGGAALAPLTWVSKLGIGDASKVHGRSGHSDAAILERRHPPGPGGVMLRYVAVFLGGFANELGTYERFVQEMDAVVAARH
jgi:hypothetical protein